MSPELQEVMGICANPRTALLYRSQSRGHSSEGSKPGLPVSPFCYNASMRPKSYPEVYPSRTARGIVRKALR